MQLLTTRNFNGVALDCYKAENEDDGFWATREQIGMLLGYNDPTDAIAKIHDRHSDRLYKFSRVDKLSRVEGSRTVTRDVIVYSFKGLLEICRFSNQPNANDVMDFVWSVMDEIRRKGIYITTTKAEELIANPDLIIQLAKEVKIERARSAELEKQTLALNAKIEDDRPKVIFADAVDASKDSILIGNFAKFLCQNGIKVGQKRLFAWLREHGYLGKYWNFPNQKYIDEGYFEVKESVVNNPDGSTRVNHTTKITGKGQIFFLNKFLDGTFQI